MSERKSSIGFVKALKSLTMTGLLTLSCAAFAQESLKIPDVYLAVDHKDCMTGCVPGYGETTCKPLCDCTVNQFKEKLSFDQYKDLRVQLSRNDVLPDMRKFLDETANYCTAEIDRMGIAVGEPDPAQN